ncbi:type II secretion system protein GspL [Catenovulum sp. 2E275]|uniref:type II secretion system protein GspL n=1 Tax=Catenovulum sp. 2E275 TaxID=2980497 RepID=UPI0021CF4DDA|nr:type II secretion system protein GspL [Catenovulum sp. 2E275]MCU4674386.1 type II secretion system protein GspL [Catenovulum sp. 2E275]
MSEQLFIRLPSQAEQSVHWLVWSTSEAEVIASGELNNVDQMSTLSERASSRNATVFVPSCDILFKQVETPAKLTRQFSQALPYMLEEELATDVDELFFAQGKKFVDDDIHKLEVAVVHKQKMQNWLDWLAQAGIKCQKMLPDTLALPDDNKVNVLQLGNEWLVRFSSFGGLNTNAEHLGFWLEQISYTQENPAICQYSPLPNEIKSRFDEQVLSEADYVLALELLAKQSAASAFNLRQGIYQYKKDSSKYFKVWRNAAIVAGVALTANLIHKGVQIHQYETQAQQLDTQIQKSYASVFPSGKNLSVAIIQKELKRKLGGIGGGSGQQSFLALVEASSGAFEAVPDLKPESLRFDFKRGEIRINASAKNFQSFEKFKLTAEQNALKVDQGSLNNQGNEVIGAISIRGES